MAADLTADLADNGTLLSIHDAEFALYATDASDAVLSQVAAGFMEKVVLDGEFTRRALQYQGGKFSGEHHEDESHTIEYHRPVFVEAREERQAAINVPDLVRNRRCGMVVRWKDAASGLWWKRSYFGVSLQPVRVEAMGSEPVKSLAHVTVKLRAERMVESQGSGGIPGMGLVSTGEVRYIKGAENISLYTYFQNLFLPVDAALLATRAVIDFDAPSAGQILLSFSGVPALRLDDAGLHCRSLDGTGPTYGTGERIEFWANGVRRATLQADGTFIAPGITDGDPVEDAAMVFMSTGEHPLLSIGALIFAPGFFDDL